MGQMPHGAPPPHRPARDKPDEITAMLSNLLTQIDGPSETRLGYIVTYMRQV